MMTVLGLLFFLPLGKLILDSMITGSGLSLSRYQTLLTDGVFMDIVLRTIWISVLVTFFTVIIGYPVAYAASRAPKWVSLLILACVTLPMFTSTLVRSYAWSAILANNGIVNEWLLRLGVVKEPLALIYNDTGIVIGMTQVLLPLMILPIFAALKSIDRVTVDAARSMGASHLAAWRSITLPRSSKGLAAGASLVFISSLGYYTTPALLGGVATPMFAQLVDTQINTRADYGPTTAEATLVLAGVVILLVLLRRPLGLMSNTVGIGGAGGRRLGRLLATPVALLRAGADRLGTSPIGRAARSVEEWLSHVRWLLAGAWTAVGIVILVGPQIVILLLAFNNSNFLSFPPQAYSTRWFSEYFHDQFWLSSTQLSVFVSVAAAAIATLIGALGAFAVVRMRRKRLSVAVYMLALTPMVLPPILYAVGLFFIYIQTGVSGTPWGLVVAYAVLGIPYVMITSQAIVRDIDPLLERAAASLGASAFKRAWTIVVPLMIPAAVASFLLAFIHAFDDLVMAVFLGSPENVTLQMRMYEDIKSEISPKVAAVGILLTGAMLVLGLASTGLRRRLSR